MRSLLPLRSIGHVTSTRIVIVLANSAEFSGEVQVQGQPSRPFSGWLGLLSALQTVTGAMSADIEGASTR